MAKPTQIVGHVRNGELYVRASCILQLFKDSLVDVLSDPDLEPFTSEFIKDMLPRLEGTFDNIQKMSDNHGK